MSCLVGELILKLGLLSASFPAFFTTFRTWSSQHYLRIDLKGFLTHACKLYVSCTSCKIFTTLAQPINIAAATKSIKWNLKASITIKDLWKLVLLFSRYVSLPYVFTPYHHQTFIHLSLFLGANMEIIRNSKIFNSAVSFTKGDERWW